MKIAFLKKKYGLDICIEAAPTVLPMFSPKLVKYAVKVLTQKGIEFSVGTPVVQATKEGVKVKKGQEFEFIKAGTIVWAAGVQDNKSLNNPIYHLSVLE